MKQIFSMDSKSGTIKINGEKISRVQRVTVEIDAKEDYPIVTLVFHADQVIVNEDF